jgi:RNA 3'-terminal phosphate cyclase
MACVTSQWDEGQSHEVVGREAADALLRQIQPRAPLDASVVEPLLLPLALAEEPSLLLVGGAVSELEATAKVIEGFLGSRISIAPEAFGRVLVQVEPG